MPKATQQYSASRRILLGGAVAAATTGSALFAASSSADAELIAACADYHATVARLIEWDARPVALRGSADAAADEAYGNGLCDQEDEAICLIGSLPAHSLPGLLAKSAVLDSIMSWGLKGCSFDSGCPQVALSLSFTADVKRVLGGVA